MTERKKMIRQRLFACKALWYASGVITLLIVVCFLAIPALTKFAFLLTLYELAVEKGMLLVWCIYFVVLALVVILNAFATLAVGMIFFSKLKEAAFSSIEKLLSGKALALSR